MRILRERASRRGTSLIEMVLIIGSVTLVLAMCGGFMHLLLRLEGAGRAALTDATSLSRLARQFRGDVRGASAAKVVPGEGENPAGLDLTAEGALLISYRSVGHEVLRTESLGEKTIRREAYRFTGLGPVAFTLEPDWVRLEIPRKASGPGRPANRIEARIAKHRAAIKGEGGDR